MDFKERRPRFRLPGDRIMIPGSRFGVFYLEFQFSSCFPPSEILDWGRVVVTCEFK